MPLVRPGHPVCGKEECQQRVRQDTDAVRVMVCGGLVVARTHEHILKEDPAKVSDRLTANVEPVVSRRTNHDIP